MPFQKTQARRSNVNYDIQIYNCQLINIIMGSTRKIMITYESSVELFDPRDNISVRRAVKDL